MGHEERRDADLQLDPPDFVAKPDPNLRVQGGERLVEQEHLRPDGERPGQGHPLLLTARHLVGISVREAAQAH